MGKAARVDVPYGNPYTPERQTTMTKEKVVSGLRDLMNLIRDGVGYCTDRNTVLPGANGKSVSQHAQDLERQMEKVLDAVHKDGVYVEEVRHHHNRISDLCDNTRDYTQRQMVADLKRSSAIRVNVVTIINGKPPEFEMEQDELDDLKTVRNMLRRKFGGRKTKGTAMNVQDDEVDQSRMMMNADEIKADVNAGEASFAALIKDAENYDESDFQKNVRGGAGWATQALGDSHKTNTRLAAAAAQSAANLGEK